MFSLTILLNDPGSLAIDDPGKIAILRLMPIRKTILVPGETYHIYNRSVQGIPIFKGQRENEIFLETIKYYLQANPPTRFSIYRTNKDKFSINHDQKLVTIINYCLMPNHFHFTLRQEEENGIRRFIQKISNSFAHYFALKYQNSGPVFEGNFKAVRIESNEQLLHLSRYIHLNPVTAYLVENPEDYPYSSYLIYIRKEKSEIINPSIVLNQFRYPKQYQKFVLDQKDYQRSLQMIKHLIIER